jgi:hypothetical protein
MAYQPAGSADIIGIGTILIQKQTTIPAHVFDEMN